MPIRPDQADRAKETPRGMPGLSDLCLSSRRLTRGKLFDVQHLVESVAGVSLWSGTNIQTDDCSPKTWVDTAKQRSTACGRTHGVHRQGSHPGRVDLDGSEVLDETDQEHADLFADEYAAAGVP